MDFQEANDYLSELQFFGIKLGLGQVTELLGHVDDPQQRLCFVHIAGTNGKGSTGALLAAGLHHAGYKVGFYSSPHLICVRERFRVDGNLIPESDFAALMTRLEPVIEDMRNEGRCPTYFEVTTVLATTYFAEQKCDFVVWETGMGGRLDATNVVDPVCSVLTPIALDHQQYLGETLEEIAGEKAGIIKPGKPVFCGVQDKCALNVIKAQAAKQNAFLHQLVPGVARDRRVCPSRHTQSFTVNGYPISLSLLGAIQVENSVLAVAVLEFLAKEFGFDLDFALAGLIHAQWPARLQVLPDGRVLDGAHNSQGAQVLVDFLEESFRGKDFECIFGGFADKDTAAVLGVLAPRMKRFCFVPVQGNRPCRSPEELTDLLGQVSTVQCRHEQSVAHAFATVDDDVLQVVTGSLFLAQEVLPMYDRDLDKVLSTDSDS